MRKGQITITTIVTGASMLAGVFAWTYDQFTAVKADASVAKERIATVEQKTVDIDRRLERIEDKQDQLIDLLKSK